MALYKITFTGFDSEGFSHFLNESTNTIDRLHSAYRKLYSQVLIESTALTVTSNIDEIDKQASGQIKEKITKFVKRILEWIAEFTQKIIEFAQNIAISNKAFIEKIKPVVEKKLNKYPEMSKKLKFITRLYYPEFIDINRFGYLNDIIQNKMHSIPMDELIDRFADRRIDHIKIIMATSALRTRLHETDDWQKFKEVLKEVVMGKQVEETFNMSFFDPIERYAVGKERDLIKTANQISKFVKIAATDLSIAARAYKFVKSKKEVIDSTIVKQKLLSCYADVLTTVANIQLSALKQQLRDCRAICLKAYNYKPSESLNENFIIEAFMESEDGFSY